MGTKGLLGCGSQSVRRRPVIELALVAPEIPPNTGNVSRMAVGLDVPLHLVEPMGFRIDEASVRRAGLDYWPALKLHHHAGFEDFLKAIEGKRAVLATAHAEGLHTDWVFEAGDVLIFGGESKGLPAEVLDAFPKEQRVRIPTWGPVRSLNLSNAVAVVAYEAARQLRSRQLWPEPSPRWPDGQAVPKPQV